MAVERSPQATAPSAPDYDDIVRIIQLYVDGFNESDISKFKRSLPRGRSHHLYRRGRRTE